jgi:DNA polymerase-1
MTDRAGAGRDLAPLLVVDTPWLLYRSFFGVPRTTRGTGGAPVNALLGTVNTIITLVDRCKPRAVVCCFGAEEAAYRVALYPPYHAHRDPMPDELREQWERAGELLAAFDWTVQGHEELEADDLLWSYSRIEAATGGRTLICSADRDLYQAVNESTFVLSLSRDGPPGEIDEAAVLQRSGVAPKQIPDLIALRGDPSDGLPGAKGIGAKTAAALLREHGTLEGVLAARLQLSPRIALTLGAQTDELRTFRHIATLQDVEVSRPQDAATNRQGGAEHAKALGMRALAARLLRA